MGATVNTLTVDNGDLLALEQARRNILGKCKVASLRLSTRESKLATYIVNANFTRVYDNFTGIEVSTREWKRVWSYGYPVRATEDCVTWRLYRHYNAGRVADDPRVQLTVTRTESCEWEAQVYYMVNASSKLVVKSWTLQANSADEVVTMLTPAALIAAKHYSERYGRNASRLVTEALPEAWNEDFKRAVNIAGGWLNV